MYSTVCFPVIHMFQFMYVGHPESKDINKKIKIIIKKME